MKLPSPNLTLAALALLVAALGARALTPPADSKAEKADPRIAIAQKLGANVEEVRPSPIAGLFEVAHGSEVLYVSADAHFVIDGDLYDADKRLNLSDQRRAGARLALLKGVSDQDAIVFSPLNPRYTVTVFTDVDCAYCRKLHGQIADYLKLGIRVRYVFYPRTGPGTDSWHKAEAVWCSGNRQEALTRAKLGENLPRKQCETPVRRTYDIGQELQIAGTPGIFTEQGDYVRGYLAPDQLLERLKTGMSAKLPLEN
jgi:thiol:disulfide interchange protein DsbC